MNCSIKTAQSIIPLRDVCHRGMQDGGMQDGGIGRINFPGESRSKKTQSKNIRQGQCVASTYAICMIILLALSILLFS